MAIFNLHQEDEIVKPLCIILPQMNGYIKYFENGGKNMSFLIKNSEVWEKYEDIWNVIKNKLNIKFHSQPIFENKYFKTKVREFDGNLYCLYNYCFCYENEQKHYPQIYLEECKYKVKKIIFPRFINIELELESDYEPDIETDLESNTTREH